MSAGQTNYWKGATGSQSWATTGNWSLGTVPVTGEYVVVANASSTIDAGLAQSAVTLAGLNIDQTFTGTIGTATVPLAISATAWQVGAPGGSSGDNGSGRIYINFGTNVFTGTILSTGSTVDAGKEPLRILGVHASNVINMVGGRLGIATNQPDEVSTMGTIRAAGSGSVVNLGKGVTWTTIINDSAAVTVTSGGTTLTTEDGVTTTQGTGLIATVNAIGGTVLYNQRPTSGNAITTLNLRGGTLDLRGDTRPLTVGTTNFRSGEIHVFDPTQLTLTALAIDWGDGLNFSASAA